MNLTDTAVTSASIIHPTEPSTKAEMAKSLKLKPSLKCSSPPTVPVDALSTTSLSSPADVAPRSTLPRKTMASIEQVDTESDRMVGRPAAAPGLMTLLVSEKSTYPMTHSL